jgi:serine/threonine protein kinase
LLGQGGMGAVYHAHDRELEREVALKVIRSDMAANPEIQELILARQIIHKNVTRIFDLNSLTSPGLKPRPGQSQQGNRMASQPLDPFSGSV